jgi:MFS transporter, FHS family, L-fucose permease
MAFASSTSAADPVPADAGVNQQYDAPDLRAYLFGLFFVFGGITSLNDIIIPDLKALFTLNNAEAMLVQSAFFTAYLVISLPGAGIVRRIGYMRTAVVGLLTMTTGCLLFVPASRYALFGAFLFALFVLGAGITIVQIVANPLICMLGAPRTAHSRLTLAQAFNSLGTTLFPRVGAIVILGALASVDPATLSGAALTLFRTSATHVIVLAYLGLAIALLIVAAVVWSRRQRLQEIAPEDEPILRSFTLLRRPRFSFGALCIFLYVGAEVAIGSFIVIFLMRDDVFDIDAKSAGGYVPYYWGGAMIGRFLGSYLLRVFSPGRVLAAAASCAIALLVVSMTNTGAVSGWALLAIGLFNSIMFPTVFSLASEGLGRRTHEGSGIMCMAIFGGAVIPILTGRVSDRVPIRMAFLVPALCYVIIAVFGIYARRPYTVSPQEVHS